MHLLQGKEGSVRDQRIQYLLSRFEGRKEGHCYRGIRKRAQDEFRALRIEPGTVAMEFTGLLSKVGHKAGTAQSQGHMLDFLEFTPREGMNMFCAAPDRESITGAEIIARLRGLLTKTQ